MDSEAIFVSYSSKDRPFALKFVKELQDLGVNVWMDQLGIKLGENWDNAIEDALENSNTFLLFISPTAVESQNVQDEVHFAIKEKKKLIPILIKECDLPMRWQRMQYADFTKNPNKGLKSVMEFLGLETKATKKLKEVLSLLGVSEHPQEEVVTETNFVSSTGETREVDLLISEKEIDLAIMMHKRGIKKNLQLIMFAAILSVALAVLLLSLGLGIEDKWLIIAGCLSINLLSIRPFGGIKSRGRKIDLIGLLKLKRDRLIRVMNKIAENEIDNFNQEFDTYITI